MNEEQTQTTTNQLSLTERKYIEQRIKAVIRRGNVIAKRRKDSMRCGGKTPRR